MTVWVTPEPEPELESPPDVVVDGGGVYIAGGAPKLATHSKIMSEHRIQSHRNYNQAYVGRKSCNHQNCSS